MSYARLHDIFTAYIDVYIYVGRRTVLQDDDRNTHEQNLSGHLPQALALTKHTHTHTHHTHRGRKEPNTIDWTARSGVGFECVFVVVVVFVGKPKNGFNKRIDAAGRPIRMFRCG